MLSSGAFLTNTWGDSDLLPACLDQLRDRGGRSHSPRILLPGPAEVDS